MSKSLFHKMITKNSKSGFTIIELLIVIVVIAILATIAIVAYSGIRARAIDTSLITDEENSAKLLANDYTVTAAYPTTTNAANSGRGLPKSNGNTYSYTVNNSSNPPTYSLTASNTGTLHSYMITDSNNVPSLMTGSAPVVTVPTGPTSSDTGGCGDQYWYFTPFSTATGSPTPTIQWQIMSPKNTTSGSWANITGATTTGYSYYENSPTSPMYDGEYHVFRAIFTSGSFTTISPTLTITRTNGC